MTQPTAPVIRLQAHFDWPKPDHQLLIAFVSTTLTSTLGVEAKFSGRIEQHGPLGTTTEYNYESPKDWASALEKGAASTYVQVNDEAEWQRNISLSVDFARREIDCWIAEFEAGIPAAQDLLARMEESLKLVRRTNQHAKNVSFMERRYYLPKPASPQDFLDALIPLSSTSQSSSQQGEIFFASPASTGQRYGEPDKWFEAVKVQWDSIIRISYWARGELIDLNLTWDFLSDNLVLRTEAPTETAASAVLAEVEKQLSITPQEQGAVSRPSLEGGERVYFANQDVDQRWFETAVEIISSYLRADFYCDLRLRITSAKQQTFFWQNIPKWKQSVLDKWSEMIEASGYFSGPSLTIQFKYDHRRERVVLEVRAHTKETAEEIFSRMTKDLNLQQTAGDTYTTPRSSGYFSISSWRNQSFADALDLAVTQYIKNKYALLKATVIEPTDDDGESFQVYDDFTKFVERLRDEKRYDAIHFEIQGPRGAALSVRMLDKRSRLEIRSSLSPAEFPNLVQVFKNNLGLKKIAATREAAEAQKVSLKDSVWILFFLPVALTLLTNFFLTDQVKNAPYSKDTLEIITPLVNKDKPIIVPRQDVHVVWVLKHEKWFKTTVLTESEADIRILNETGETVGDKQKVRPGISFRLSPGTYQAIVTMSDYGLQEKVSFEIPATAK